MENTVTWRDGRCSCPASDCHSTFTHKVSLLRHISKEHSAASGTSEVMQVDKPDIVLDLLNRIDCIVNPKYKLIICKHRGCDRAIDASLLEKHLLSHTIELSVEEMALIKSSFTITDRTEFYNTFTGTLDIVQGVPVTEDGIYCPFKGCEAAVSSVKSLKKHCANEHSSKTHACGYLRGPFQSVFGSSCKNTRVNAYSPTEDCERRRAAFIGSVRGPVAHKLEDCSMAMLSPL